MKYTKKLQRYLLCLAGAAIIALTPTKTKADLLESVQTPPGTQLEVILGYADVDKVVSKDGKDKEVDITKRFSKSTIKYRTKDGKNLFMIGIPYVEVKNNTANQSAYGIGDTEITVGRQGKFNSWMYMCSLNATIPTGSHGKESKANCGSGDYKIGAMLRGTRVWNHAILDAGVGIEHNFGNDEDSLILRLTPGLKYDQIIAGLETIATTGISGGEYGESVTTGPIIRFTPKKGKWHLTAGVQQDVHVRGGPKKLLGTLRLRYNF